MTGALTGPAVPPATLAKAETAPRLHRLAEELEASFLSEMLGFAGLDTPSDSFGGGIGEDQFGSFLRHEQATAMVKAGGIGLAEQLFKSMIGGSNADHG